MRRGWDRAAGGPRCADRATHAGRALGMDGDSFSTTVKVSSAPVTAVTSATDPGSVSQAAVPTTTPGLRTLHRALPAPPVLSHVLGGGPLGRVSVSTFLSPWWGLPAGRGGAQEESELEGTPKAMARSGEVWISGGGSRRLWGHSPRWQHRPEHGAAGSPRVSSRGAASELWPYLVHGGKGSWWGPGQFSARGPGGPGELGGAAAAGTRHPLIGSPGPVLRAGAEGRTDPDGPHTPQPQWRAALPSAPPRSRVETSRLPLAGQGRRLQRG